MTGEFHAEDAGHAEFDNIEYSQRSPRTLREIKLPNGI